MKQKRPLMISLLLLAVALAYAWGQYPRQQRLAPAAGISPGRVSPSASTSTSEGGVRLYLLTREGEQFSGFRRDLFSPLYAE
ncbi:MAG: type II secretion system protein PulP, partial [Desulfuromonadales bacterium]|nr:type II secretion system protein PulP [Desulfuromonadales bacterium]